MIVLSATDISKIYGVDTIIEDVSFHINEGDRIGIVGANGAGKTTLLNVLSGRLQPDTGNFFVSKDRTIGYLKQKDTFEQTGTLIEEINKIFKPLSDLEAEIADLTKQIAAAAEASGQEEAMHKASPQNPASGQNGQPSSPAGSSSVSASGQNASGPTSSGSAHDNAMCQASQPSPADLHKLMERYATLQERFEKEGGFTYKSEIKGILNSMAFGEEFYDKPISTLSGGERTRLALASLLLEKPDILFLDEPTNHLDIGTLKWLEQYIKAYKGTIVLVSHDRYFLDQTVTRIFEIERHKLKCYDGNYTEFAEKKRQLREADMRAYSKQQTEIKRQEDMIRRFKERGTEHLAKRAASREKRLDQVQRLDKPEGELGHMKIRFHQEFESGKDVLYGEDLAKSFGFGASRRDLFEHVDFDIKKGERICIVGPNGIGKTTLLKVMMGEMAPTDGYMKTGHNVVFGYYDQTQQLLNDEATVMDEVHDSFRLYKDAEVRSILGRFLFKDDQVFLKVGSLSGGEKARLALLKLMLSGANVLMLDEPTNHLDIDSKEVFEDALLDYPGTMIVVSHDRYFLNKIPTRILELGSEGFTQYLGKYDYYVEKKSSIDSGRKYLRELSDTSKLPAGGNQSRGGQFGDQSRGDNQSNQSRDGNAAGPGAGLSGTAGTGPDMNAAAGGTAFDPPAGSAEERAAKKKIEAERRRQEREKQALEDLIAKLEGDIAGIEAEMCKPANLSNSKKLRELSEKAADKKDELDAAYDKWLEM